jgi:hypothetical protein
MCGKWYLFLLLSRPLAGLDGKEVPFHPGQPTDDLEETQTQFATHNLTSS